MNANETLFAARCLFAFDQRGDQLGDEFEP